MHRALALAALWGAGCATQHLALEISGEPPTFDRLLFTVLGPHGALVLDQAIPGAGGRQSLPGRVRLDPGTRRERVRVLAWAALGETRVAFATAEVDLGAPPASIPLRLAAPIPPDSDGDAVPDQYDGCPCLPDPGQADGDADGLTDACRPPGTVDRQCPNNLIANGSFDRSSDGWMPESGGSLKLVAGRGGCAVRVCPAPGTDRTSIYPLMNTSVESALSNERYRLSGWVRQVASTADALALLRTWEASPMVSKGVPVPLNSSWQYAEVADTMRSDARLEGYFGAAAPAPPDTCLDLDDACLQKIR